MKFELEPDNRNCTDELLLEDLKSVANRLGKESLSQEEYKHHGRFSSATMKNRFGSWNKALEMSGLFVKKRANVSEQELLADLKRVAKFLVADSISQAEYEQHGNFSVGTFSKKFETWKNALSRVDLKPSPLFNEKSTEDELLKNLAVIWENLGRQPKISDLSAYDSKFSADTYKRRYGSWRNALERCLELVAEEDENLVRGPEVKKDLIVRQVFSNEKLKRKTSRNPSWRLVFLVYRKNNFSCVICGKSPVTHQGTILHVDHINPWSKGGETTIDNLQTLCSHCNLGKSDLSMTEI